MSTLENVFNARRKAQEELRSLYNDAGDNELTGEQKVTEERLSGVISEMEQREAVLIRMADDEKRALEAAAKHGAGEGTKGKAPESQRSRDVAGIEAMARGEQRSVMLGIPEARDLTKGTATDGAELVPTSLYNQIHELIEEESNIVGLAQVMRTAGGEDLVLPRVTSHSTAALVAEAGSIGESDPQFDTVTLGAYKLAFAVDISSELEQDAAFNVADYVVRQGARALGRGADAYFVSGSGSSQPAGIDTADTGMTTAAVGAVTMDELIEAQHSVIAPQRNRAVWILGDSTIEAVRKLKDGDNNYLWQPSNQAGVPSLLLGRPVYADPNLADMGAGNTFGVFGDPSGFAIRWAGGVRIDRSEESKFLNDLVTYRFIVRIDSDIVDTTGIRKLVNAAS